jgi:ACS family hexuronate transporter-like MFS transporter
MLLREAMQATQSRTIEERWHFVVLVTAAIAISYFDRQTLPVAISSIE